LNVDRTLGVDASELVGRLQLVRPGVVHLRVLERQGHVVLVHRHDTLCARLESLAVLRPSHRQPTVGLSLGSGQLSLLSSAGREMSTGHSAVMLCGWGVKAVWLTSLVDKRVVGT